MCSFWFWKKKKIQLNQYGDYSLCEDLVSKKYLNWQLNKRDKVDLIEKNYNQKIEVECTPLNNILEMVDAPNIIDFFSLDVEGSEKRVLEGINFSKYKFKFLLIEITFNQNDIINFLKKKKYILIKNITPWDYLFKIEE